MDQIKLIEQISIWKNDPVKYIELLEETSGQKFYWYQKMVIKRLLKKNRRMK